MARQVLSAVFPPLKTQWGLTDSQLGLLSGVVAVAVGVLTCPTSLVAERPEKAWEAADRLWPLAVILETAPRRAVSAYIHGSSHVGSP